MVIGERLNPERRDRPQLPDARQVLDSLDRGMLPLAIELGIPKIGERRLRGPELHAKYEPLSRRHLSEAVGLDALRAEANGGGKSVRTDDGATHDSHVVYKTPEGMVRFSQSHMGTDGSSSVRYEELPEGEEVTVQHREWGGVHRHFSLTLGKGRYSFSSERYSGGQTRVHVYGKFGDDPEGNITEPIIETAKFDG
jgi:hypothetical protein